MTQLLSLIPLGVAALLAAPALAQDTLTAPPPDAVEIGLLLDRASGIIQVLQQETAVGATCGQEQPFGCITWITDGNGNRVCQIHLWIGLEGEARAMIYQNLVAQCGGWAPTMAQARP